jgi:gamma-glutamylputrescine oxidase
VEREFNYSNYQLMDKQQAVAATGCETYHGGMFDTTGGHLHPLNYALGLAEAAAKAGARICEFTPATEIDYSDPAVITTDKGRITADYIILGCNGYLGGLEPRVACNMIAVDDYQIATQPLSEEQLGTILPSKACVYNTKYLLHYYRLSSDNRLIFGGGHGRPGQEPDNMKGIVRKHMLDVYPQLSNVEVDYAWAGTDTFTMSEMPDFGRLAHNAFYAHGYTGHGVALSTLAGQLMAESIAGAAERFDVFTRIPQRKIPGSTMFRSPMIMIGIKMFAVLDWLRK